MNDEAPPTMKPEFGCGCDPERLAEFGCEAECECYMCVIVAENRALRTSCDLLRRAGTQMSSLVDAWERWAATPEAQRDLPPSNRQGLL